MGHLALSQREPSGPATLCVCVCKLYRSSECMKAATFAAAGAAVLSWDCEEQKRERQQGKSVLALQHGLSAIGCVEAVTRFPDSCLSLPVLLCPA